MNTKQSNWAGTLGASAAVGSGTFALGALIQEVMRQRDANAQRNRQQLPDNALVIDLPRRAEKKAADLSAPFLKQADGMLSTALALLAGAPAGYLGTKALYDGVKKKQTDREIGDANLKYMQTLQALQQKTAALSLPYVEQFCKAAAENLVKDAGLEKVLPWLATQGAKIPGAARTGQWVTSHAPQLKRSLPALAGGTAAGVAADDFGAFDWLKSNPATPGPGTFGAIKDGAKDAWLTMAVLSALGGAGAMVHANNKKTNRENSGPPSAVALNYEDIPPAAALQH